MISLAALYHDTLEQVILGELDGAPSVNQAQQIGQEAFINNPDLKANMWKAIQAELPPLDKVNTNDVPGESTDTVVEQ